MNPSGFRFSFGNGQTRTREPTAHQASVVVVGKIPSNLGNTRALRARDPSVATVFPVPKGVRAGRFSVSTGEPVFCLENRLSKSSYGRLVLPVFSSFHELPRDDLKHLRFIGVAEADHPDTGDRGRNQVNHGETFTVVVHGTRDVHRHSNRPCHPMDMLFWDQPDDLHQHAPLNSGARGKAVSELRPLSFERFGGPNLYHNYKLVQSGQAPELDNPDNQHLATILEYDRTGGDGDVWEALPHRIGDVPVQRFAPRAVPDPAFAPRAASGPSRVTPLSVRREYLSRIETVVGKLVSIPISDIDTRGDIENRIGQVIERGGSGDVNDEEIAFSVAVMNVLTLLEELVKGVIFKFVTLLSDGTMHTYKVAFDNPTTDEALFAVLDENIKTKMQFTNLCKFNFERWQNPDKPTDPAIYFYMDTFSPAIAKVKPGYYLDGTDPLSSALHDFRLTMSAIYDLQDEGGERIEDVVANQASPSSPQPNVSRDSHDDEPQQTSLFGSKSASASAPPQQPSFSRRKSASASVPMDYDGNTLEVPLAGPDEDMEDDNGVPIEIAEEDEFASIRGDQVRDLGPLLQIAHLYYQTIQECRVGIALESNDGLGRSQTSTLVRPG